MTSTIEIFICYAHEDELLCKRLLTYLEGLKRQGLFKVWYDRKILPGEVWAQKIDSHLNTAEIILMLVSPDFIASDYCYLVEMTKAIQRHDLGNARVIPVILSPVYWQETPFGKLEALPTDGKPVIGPGWYNLDYAFYDVAEGIRKVIKDLS